MTCSGRSWACLRMHSLTIFMFKIIVTCLWTPLLVHLCGPRAIISSRSPPMSTSVDHGRLKIEDVGQSQQLYKNTIPYTGWLVTALKIPRAYQVDELQGQ